MLQSFPRHTVLLMVLALASTGCAQRRTPPVGGMSQSTQAAPDDSSMFVMKQGQVNVTKRLPRLIELGQDVSYSIQLQASEDANNVTVHEQIPANAKYVRSDPQAVVTGNQLVWRFPQLAKGSSKILNITLKPQEVGRIEGYTSVTVEPQVYAATMVGQPKLVLKKTAPTAAMVGDDVTYTLEVTNTGTYVAKSVVLTDRVPEGMSHASGNQEVVIQVGDLEPGQTRTIPLVLRSNQKGQKKNIAVIDAANAAAVKAEIQTIILLQTVKVTNKGLGDQYVGKPVSYDITVSNPGDVPLKSLMVTNSMPAEGKILQASGATLTGNSAAWNIAQLSPGQEQKFYIVATVLTPGVYKNTVKATSAEGVSAENEFSTLWRGLPGLSLQMTDLADPIREGDKTEFNISLTNQGSAADTNIRVQMSFPSGLQPLSAGGASAGDISDQTVSFAPVVALAPKQTITWTVVAKGVAVGDNRTRVQYTSDNIKVPVSKDESTQVY